jgi:hypothetical protein
MMPRQRLMLRHIPVALVLLALGGIYVLLSGQFALGPRGLVPGLILVLVVLLLVTVRSGQARLRRTIGLMILGVVTVAEVLSTGLLISGLITSVQQTNQTSHMTALVLLRDASLLWIVNILTFSLWYWEIDGGGPGHRHCEGYHSDDFLFPQVTRELPGQGVWLPHYVDYLFLAFSTSTAFSATDTAALSGRAKLLMMAQALISLTVLAIIAARAVNTL